MSATGWMRTVSGLYLSRFRWLIAGARYTSNREFAQGGSPPGKNQSPAKSTGSPFARRPSSGPAHPTRDCGQRSRIVADESDISAVPKAIDQPMGFRTFGELRVFLVNIGRISTAFAPALVFLMVQNNFQPVHILQRSNH